MTIKVGLSIIYDLVEHFRILSGLVKDPTTHIGAKAPQRRFEVKIFSTTHNTSFDDFITHPCLLCA
jgi:hypothetical protein